MNSIANNSEQWMETDNEIPYYDYDYDYEITLFEHKQNQHIHIIIVQ